MKKIFVLLVLCNCTYLFGSGSGDRYIKMSLNQNFDRYVNGEMPIQIRENHPERDFERNYEYLGNGLVIIEYRNNLPGITTNIGKYLCYNEYYNDNIISPYKINEFVPIMEISDYGPYYTTFTDSSLVITENYNERTNYNRYNILVEFNYNGNRYGQNMTGIMSAIMVFDNETNRLSDLQVTNIVYPIIDIYMDNRNRVNIDINNYEFIYDHLGRLENIFTNYNGEKILIKSYFYDGIFRVFEQPYFNAIEGPTLEEIVIYDNQTLKYHLRLFYGRHHYREPDTVETRNSDYFYTIFTYEENKNEINQIKHYGDNDQFIISSEVIETDIFGNWTVLIFQSERYTINCTREIIYH